MKKEKEGYTAPALRLPDLNLKGAFCASTTDANIGDNNPFGDTEYDI